MAQNTAYNDLLHTVKEAVQTVDPDAKVYLYGSRARGDATADADWDFLVLLHVPVDWRVRASLRRRLYDVELSTGQIISTVIHNEAEWNRPLRQAMPFHRNVSREGIAI